ncbi:MAG: protein phosphatase 2C domain-containing protein [Casimicrobiaceae bacterium]|nr:protein phosphatase 2C domain-containing protein [Casimicrobiaceae bacterium]MCX8098415.1 protein phosphatase 2C domain-containing protein [Casimicrobiaceae bacterium]MDW8311127.1 protein phosphatase 2C domain-containing protein [Burkholderiales bacterium]
MEFSIYQESRRGTRKVNQDRVGYVYTSDAMLMVVCDGMGGHVGGEIAAHLTVRLLIERFQSEAKPILMSPVLFLQRSLLAAHSALADYAERFRLPDTPRTTCVACVIQDEAAYWAHAGDARLYHLRHGRILARTRDHSKVQYLLDSHLISSQEAVNHPDRHKVFSCLGGDIEPTIDFSPRVPLLRGDVLVLCTDGLWSAFSDNEFAQRMTAGPLATVVPEALTESERRSVEDCDNLSVIALAWAGESDDWSDAQTTTTTDTLALGEFSTQLDRTITLLDPETGERALSEEEIQKAIQEIQEALKRYGGS